MLNLDQITDRTVSRRNCVMTDFEALSRAYDVYLIKNVMGRHAYHHALGTHRAELDEIWSKRDDISWATTRASG